VTRQVFENIGDVARENAAAEVLARAWRCEMRPAPPLAGYDFTAYRGGIPLAVVEIKSRLSRSPGDFGGTLFLNVHKRDSLMAAADERGIAAIFAWHFRREIRWIDMGRLAGRPAERRGRSDRDGLDERPALRIELAETGRVDLAAIVWGRR
jgi:hypothetical protein